MTRINKKQITWIIIIVLVIADGIVIAKLKNSKSDMSKIPVEQVDTVEVEEVDLSDQDYNTLVQCGLIELPDTLSLEQDSSLDTLVDDVKYNKDVITSINFDDLDQDMTDVGDYKVNMVINADAKVLHKYLEDNNFEVMFNLNCERVVLNRKIDIKVVEKQVVEEPGVDNNEQVAQPVQSNQNKNNNSNGQVNTKPQPKPKPQPEPTPEPQPQPQPQPEPEPEPQPQPDPEPEVE